MELVEFDRVCQMISVELEILISDYFGRKVTQEYGSASSKLDCEISFNNLSSSVP